MRGNLFLIKGKDKEKKEGVGIRRMPEMWRALTEDTNFKCANINRPSLINFK